MIKNIYYQGKPVDYRFIKKEIDCDIHNLKEVEKIAPHKLKKFKREFEANIKRYAKNIFGVSNRAKFDYCFNFLKEELKADWRICETRKT